LLLIAFVYFEQFQAAFHGNFRMFLTGVFVVVGSTLLCLLVERLTISWFIKHRRTPPDALKYLSALVETSIPTAGMIVGSFFLGPIYPFFTPAIMIYPLFISLSALRLNVWLCFFTGFVAGVEYGILSMYFVSKVPAGSAEPILLGVGPHLFKAFLLFMTGVV